MIKNDRRLLEFGSGDIGIGIGAVKGTATLVFINQEVRPLGTLCANGEPFYDLQPDDVMMTFSNPESIDVMIRCLQMVRTAAFPEEE